MNHLFKLNNPCSSMRVSWNAFIIKFGQWNMAAFLFDMRGKHIFSMPYNYLEYRKIE